MKQFYTAEVKKEIEEVLEESKNVLKSLQSTKKFEQTIKDIINSTHNATELIELAKQRKKDYEFCLETNGKCLPTLRAEARMVEAYYALKVDAKIYDEKNTMNVLDKFEEEPEK